MFQGHTGPDEADHGLLPGLLSLDDVGRCCWGKHRLTGGMKSRSGQQNDEMFKVMGNLTVLLEALDPAAPGGPNETSQLPGQ